MGKLEPGYIVCVPWGRQRVHSIRVSCAECEQPLALAADNKQACGANDIEPICEPCAAKMTAEKPQPFGGLMVGGQTFDDPRKAELELQLQLRRN